MLNNRFFLLNVDKGNQWLRNALNQTSLALLVQKLFWFITVQNGLNNDAIMLYKHKTHILT